MSEGVQYIVFQRYTDNWDSILSFLEIHIQLEVGRDLRDYFVLWKGMKRIWVIFAFDHLNVSRNLGSTTFFFFFNCLEGYKELNGVLFCIV